AVPPPAARTLPPDWRLAPALAPRPPARAAAVRARPRPRRTRPQRWRLPGPSSSSLCCTPVACPMDPGRAAPRVRSARGQPPHASCTRGGRAESHRGGAEMARGPRGWPSRYEREFFRDYLERMERAERMGMHDLTERYGRYSGGPPDSYEYSERVVEHRRRPA